MSDQEGPPDLITRPAVGCVAAIIVAMIVIWVFFACVFSATIIQSDRPLSVSEARNVEVLSHWFFPDSACNIRFAYESGPMVALDCFVRFEAPVSDCLAFAEKEMADYNANHPQAQPFLLSPSTAPVSRDTPFSTILKHDWFDVYEIKNGMEGGHLGHKLPKVWVDLDRGVLYYMLTD